MPPSIRHPERPEGQQAVAGLLAGEKVAETLYAPGDEIERLNYQRPRWTTWSSGRRGRVRADPLGRSSAAG